MDFESICVITLYSQFMKSTDLFSTTQVQVQGLRLLHEPQLGHLGGRRSREDGGDRGDEGHDGQDPDAHLSGVLQVTIF